MQRLAVALLVIAACGGNSGTRPPDGHAAADALIPDSQLPDAARLADAAIDGVPVDGMSSGPCNVLTQTGCSAAEKCTWIVDTTTPQISGHIGCVPNGAVATGGACTTGQPGPTTGYDNCVRGDYCSAAHCKAICDPQGGAPMCAASAACSTYSGVFGDPGQPLAAGVCDPRCDPLADNDFLHTGSKPGTICTEAQGCYGYPNGDGPKTAWTCTNEVNSTLTHRFACTSANGCASAGGPYLNGCAQGYVPLLYDNSTGSMQVDCIALCKPADCYQGHCGTNSANLGGVAPHACTTTYARGTFNVASATNNGDQCMYSWLFELDFNGVLNRSLTSDTVGFCVDHSKYRYDSNGDGQITTADAVWPKCDTFASPGYGATSLGAGDFGCVSTATAGVMFTGKPRPSLVTVRLPYGPLKAP